MANQINFSHATGKDRQTIIGLLQSEKLPIEDLPGDLSNFFVATDNGFIIGAIGMERYQDKGLLRSLVVNQEYRNMKVGAQLINQIERLCRSMGLSEIYLLTETAEEYFSKSGYKTIDRMKAPASIQQSSEFSHVCPSSAILMLKGI